MPEKCKYEPLTAAQGHNNRLCRWDERPLSGRQEDFCSDLCRMTYHNAKRMRPEDRARLREMAVLDAMTVPERRYALMIAAAKMGVLR